MTRIDLTGKRPLIMGILNVTPDSFSDGGEHLLIDDAVSHAMAMVSEGADIIDVGGESSRPGAMPVSSECELSRVIPVIEGIRKRSDIPISIDTMKSSVALTALEAGADMINDISAGRTDTDMLGLAAGKGSPICLMHMRGTPGTMQDDTSYADLIGEICDFLSSAVERARAVGIGDRNILLDPGIGFGKTAEGNVEIIKNLYRFAVLGFPILIGPSRKSFIGKLLGLNVKDRLEATLATIPACIDGGAKVIRLHDVGPARRFIDMYTLLSKGPTPV
jgi:dihydropteroate synthase